MEYAEFLIVHHPDDWNGYGRAAQALIALRRFEEAEVKIQEGLQAIPNQANLLISATDVFRARKDYVRSLKYAEHVSHLIHMTGMDMNVQLRIL